MLGVRVGGSPMPVMIDMVLAKTASQLKLSLRSVRTSTLWVLYVSPCVGDAAP